MVLLLVCFLNNILFVHKVFLLFHSSWSRDLFSVVLPSQSKVFQWKVFPDMYPSSRHRACHMLYRLLSFLTQTITFGLYTKHWLNLSKRPEYILLMNYFCFWWRSDENLNSHDNQDDSHFTFKTFVKIFIIR